MAKKINTDKDQPSKRDSVNDESAKKYHDEEFPDYPHYSAKEDIMNAKDAERITVDIDNLSRSNLTTSAATPDKSAKPAPADAFASVNYLDNDAVKIVPGTEADVTKDDLIALAERDDDSMKNETLSGDDLDVPGSEEDDANEEIGEEDEENNYYSLGGDAYENLEEDKE